MGFDMIRKRDYMNLPGAPDKFSWLEFAKSEIAHDFGEVIAIEPVKFAGVRVFIAAVKNPVANCVIAVMAEPKQWREDGEDWIGVHMGSETGGWSEDAIPSLDLLEKLEPLPEPHEYSRKWREACANFYSKRLAVALGV